MDDGGLSKGQHSSHLCLSADIHPQLRCSVMQEGPARGTWSHSKRDIYVSHVPLWEREMSNSQTSAMAGERQLSTKEKKSPGEQGLGSPQGPEEPESRRWHLSTSLSQGKHPAAPEVLSETLWPSWHSESWELFSTPALGRGELSASQVSQGSSSPGMNPCGSQSPSASPAARVAIASSPCGETEAQ